MSQPPSSGSWPTTIVVVAEVYEHLRMVHRSGDFSGELRAVMGGIVAMLQKDAGLIARVRSISMGEGLKNATIQDATKKTRMTMNIAMPMIAEITRLADEKSVGVVMRAGLMVLFERDATMRAASGKRAVS